MIDIKVDDDFARFGSKSYAINKINSVEVRERQPHGKACAVIFGVIAALTALIGISPSDLHKASMTTVIVALIFAAVAYVLWERSKIREYQLFLMTSSSETQAFITQHADEVVTLRNEIEQAMLRHSRAAFRVAT